jgi:hypothetical protein
MKAVIQECIFKKEFDTKFGKMFSFQVKYDDKVAFYNSKSKDQRKFVEGQETEFTEESKTYTDKNGETREYFVVKPVLQQRQSGYGKALNKEQSRYSGFAMSYAKDLVVAGIIKHENIIIEARWLFDEMVAMDKTLES